MSEWTELVGDPVLSKWIVVAFVVSILLNGYLLKGIASSTAADGASGPSAVAAAAARFVSGAGGWEGQSAPKNVRRWSGGIQLERRSDALKADEPSAHAEEPVRKRRSSVLSGLVMPIPVYLPHPAPHSILEHKSGDSTPTSSDGTKTLNGQISTREIRGDGADHLVINKTPTVPIFNPRITGVDGNEGSPSSLSREDLPHFGRRTLEECWEVYAGGLGAFELSDEEVILLVQKGKVPSYKLEKDLKDMERAVRIRRAVFCESVVDLIRAYV